ncbi:MAG: acyl-CoA dehydrogenase family protein, partial [Pseudomonadota bacterium]
MFDFDFGLGEDIDLLRETVAGFATDKIAPRAAAIDSENKFPLDLWPELGELGLHGMTVDPDYGGSGLGYLAHVVAMEEISRASAKQHTGNGDTPSHFISFKKDKHTVYIA